MQQSANQTDPAGITESRPNRSGRDILLLLVKITLAPALMYWLISSGRLDQTYLLNIQWSQRAVGLVVLGVGAVLSGILLLAWRLRLLVGCGGIDLPLGRAYSLTSIGLFSAAILPGAVGGDLVKIIYLCRGEAASQRVFATLAIVCDRTIGLFSLLLFGALVTVLAWLTDSLPFWSPVLWLAPTGVLATIGAVGLLVGRGVVARAIPVLQGRSLPRRLRQLIAVGDLFARRPRLILGCVGLALANHFLVCATFLIGGELLGGLDLSLLQQLLLNPLAMVANAIPVTPGGLGLAEGAFSYLYGAAGCSLGAATGILGRTIQYAAYTIVGLPALVLRGK